MQFSEKSWNILLPDFQKKETISGRFLKQIVTKRGQLTQRTTYFEDNWLGGQLIHKTTTFFVCLKTISFENRPENCFLSVWGTTDSEENGLKRLGAKLTQRTPNSAENNSLRIQLTRRTTKLADNLLRGQTKSEDNKIGVQLTQKTTLTTKSEDN